MNAPEIRFPEFKEPWRSTTAGAAFKHSRARGEAGLPIYSVTLDRGMVRRDSLDRHMESDAADGQNLRAQAGDVVYNMMRMWQGAVGVAPEECMVSPAYVVLRPTKETNPQFFNYWFQNSRMLHKLGAYSHGLTKDRLRLYPDDFAKIPLSLPSRDEQDRIAAFFEGIDAKLAVLRKKVDGVCQFKTGLMQRLFSQELRFTREDGSDFANWQDRKLGDLFGWVRTNSLSREHLTDDDTSGVQNIHYGDIHSKFRAIFRQSYEEVPFITSTAPLRAIPEEVFVRPGDVVIADASEDYADIGKAIEVMEVREGSMIAGLHTFIARPKQGVLAPGFAGYLLRSAPLRRQIVRAAQGVSVLGLSKGNLENLTLWLPVYEEQEKIAVALMAVDTKIDAVMDQITQMETFKKGLLQKMFV